MNMDAAKKWSLRNCLNKKVRLIFFVIFITKKIKHNIDKSNAK